MNEWHQEKIVKYRDYLIDNTRFDDLWQTLTEPSFGNQHALIFTDRMIQDILDPTNDCGNECRNERFYDLLVTSVHPEAFNILKNALSASGHNDLTKLLLEDKLVCTSVDMSSRRNAHPAIPPLLDNVKVSRSPSLSKWGTVRRLYTSYVVQSSPRGYLLLINMRFIMNPLTEERKGSEVDVKNLKSLFTQLNYEIVEYQDLTLAGMEEAIDKFSHMKELAEVDSVLVFVMSHGRDPSKRKPQDPPLKSPGRESVDIELEDNQYINSNDIADRINQSSTIRPNTPRMFFFNVCRGSKIDFGQNGRVTIDSSDHIPDTSTEVDAFAFTPPHPIPSRSSPAQPHQPNVSPNENGFGDDQTLPENNIPANGSLVSHENTLASNTLNGNESNGYYGNGFEANGFHDNNNRSVSFHGNVHESQHVSTPSDTNHAQSNGNGPHQTPPPDGSIAPVSLRGGCNNRLTSFKGSAPSLLQFEPTNYSASCCCIPRTNFTNYSNYKDKDKRSTRLVRCAIWCARLFKCSMPSIEREDATDRVSYASTMIVQENENENAAGSSYPSNGQRKTEPAVSSHPGGSQHATDPIDIPTTHLTLEESEPPLVAPSSSKGSATSNGSIRSAISGVIHSISNFHLPHKSHNQTKLTGDIFMAFSTVDGYNSKRHPSRGSWFVTFICQVFAESAKDTDLVSMMEEVDRRMRENCDERYGTQMYVKKTEGFSKKFFFNVERAGTGDSHTPQPDKI